MAENDFPPIVTHMSKQVGKKNELNIVIPKTSKLYYEFTKEENPFLKDDARFENSVSSFVNHAMLDKHITSIEKSEDFIILKLNTEKMNYQIIRVVEDYNINNQFIFDYKVAHGYVLKIEITNHREGLDSERVFDELKYMSKKYRTALFNLGYKTLIWKGDTFKNDTNVVIIKTQVYSSGYTYSLIIYEKSIHKQYSKTKREIEQLDIESEYQVLNTILK